MSEEFGSVGERLRSERERQQIALEDVAARTRIPTRHLVAIERGDYATLPAATYSAGFVKTYARLLGLDAQPLSEEFRGEMGVVGAPQQQLTSYEPVDPRRSPPVGLALLALLVLVLLGVGYLYWRGSVDQPTELAARGPQESTAAPAAIAPAPAPLAPAPVAAAPAPVTGGAVVLGATKDVWIKVSDGDHTLFMGVLKAGDRYELPADALEPLLTTGRPGSTTITVGTTAIPTIGDPDRIAKNVSLKSADLLARASAPAPVAQPPAGAPTPVENSAAPY